MTRYTTLLQYPLRRCGGLLAILALTAISSAVTALYPWPMKILVDYALEHTGVPPPLLAGMEALSLDPTPAALAVVAALASLALFMLNSGLEAGLTWAWSGVGQYMLCDLTADLFARLQRLSLLFHSRRSVGDLLSRLTGDSWCVYTLTEALLVSPAQHLLTIATVGVLAWKIDPELAALSLIVSPAMAASVFLFGGWLTTQARLNREAQSRLLSFVHQTLTAVPLVQAFGTEDRNGREFRRLSAEAIALSRRGAIVSTAYGLANGLTMTLAAALVLYLGGRRALAGAVSVGTLLVFVYYLRAIYDAAQGLLGTYQALRSAQASMDRVLEVLGAEDQVREAPGARALPATGTRGQVRVEGVTFGYEPGRPVLRGITVEARPGETVALVGPTGAGKSTLVALIPRFFDPWEGRVSLDGLDVRELRLASLRAQMALVLQEPFLLPLTVAENIGYGRPGASRAEIVAAAEAANADEFIRRLPQGYDTPVGERGATLSGGEKQRLAIARALLKDAPVLILDEPTSALDAQTESGLLEALERLMKGRTTFIIAHRLSTIRRADRIVVLEQGQVVEAGTQQELLASQGLYHRLQALQLAAR